MGYTVPGGYTWTSTDSMATFSSITYDFSTGKVTDVVGCTVSPPLPVPKNDWEKRIQLISQELRCQKTHK